jgi:hypothetical protein
MKTLAEKNLEKENGVCIADNESWCWECGCAYVTKSKVQNRRHEQKHAAMLKAKKQYDWLPMSYEGREKLKKDDGSLSQEEFHMNIMKSHFARSMEQADYDEHPSFEEYVKEYLATETFVSYYCVARRNR